MSTILATALTGNVASTVGYYPRNPQGDPAAIVITSAVGATPTVSVAIQGSVDNVNWVSIPYALIATPTTFVTTALTITTAVTNIYLLQGPVQPSPYAFVRLNLTSNTNVTLGCYLLS